MSGDGGKGKLTRITVTNQGTEQERPRYNLYLRLKVHKECCHQVITAHGGIRTMLLQAGCSKTRAGGGWRAIQNVLPWRTQRAACETPNHFRRMRYNLPFLPPSYNKHDDKILWVPLDSFFFEFKVGENLSLNHFSCWILIKQRITPYGCLWPTDLRYASSGPSP